MAASIFSLQHARALLNDPLSMVKKTTCRKHIILPPCYLDKLKTGIREVLSAETKQYSESFQGVLIAYENVQLIQPFGSFLSDQPFLHFDIQSDFIVFQPTIGCTLEGVVNKIGRNHVGFLVHGCFNGMAPRSSVEPDELWLGDQLQLGQGFTFEVTYLDLTSKVLFIRGKILSIRENQNDDNWDKEAVAFDATEESSKLLANHTTQKRKRYFEEELNENIQPIKKQKTSSQTKDNLNNDNHSESLFSSDSVSDINISKSYSNNFNSLNYKSDNSVNTVNQTNLQTKKLKKLKKNGKKKKTREKSKGTMVKDTISDQSSRNKTLGRSALCQKNEEKFTLKLNSNCTDSEEDKNKDNFETDQLDSYLIKLQEKKKRKLEGNAKIDVSDLGLTNYSSDDTHNEAVERPVSENQNKKTPPINAKLKHKTSKEKRRKKKVKDHLRKKNKKKDKRKKSHSLKVKREKKHSVKKKALHKKKH